MSNFEGITVTKSMTTETAHRLTEYVGKCASIHGHSYKWEVTAAMQNRGVGFNGIAIDFGDLKKAMRDVIYDPFDHALVLDVKDPLCQLPMMRYDAAGSPQKLVQFPGNPTAEHMARFVLVQLATRLPNHDIIRVRVYETADSYAQCEDAGPSSD